MKSSLFVLALAAALAVPPAVADTSEYKGFRVCTKCHDAQGDAWKGTAHAKAFESLKPNVKAEAKTRAKLDPAADYSANKDCVGCHTTGYGETGGYRIGIDPDEARVLLGVGCEACHGPGGRYRNLHGEASDRLKSTGDTTSRRNLVDAGQNFDYERACARCHLNYPGSPLANAAPPHTPFTPAVDGRYRHDFRKAVLAGDKGNPVHAHFKLRGVFKGDPVPPIRAEVQAGARELEE